jgi:uncharacterized surface protein with fasciclin (FAS1) repeats
MTADGTAFDNNWKDFDVVEQAVLDVLTAKPKSPLNIVTKGKKRVTAFLPNDRAFRTLVTEATGTAPATEQEAYTTLTALAGDSGLVEQVLLYHLVPGKTLTYRQLKKSGGDKLTTLQGGVIKVKVRGKRVSLVDLDPDDKNAHVIVPRNINKGNRQIAQAVNLVLRPIDLQPPPS